MAAGQTEELYAVIVAATEDDGRYLRYVPREKVARIYADNR